MHCLHWQQRLGRIGHRSNAETRRVEIMQYLCVSLWHESIYVYVVQIRCATSPVLLPNQRLLDSLLTPPPVCTHHSVLCVKLLLITFHINTTFELSARGSQFESCSAVFNRFVQFVETLLSAVLERVLQASGKIWDELGDGSGNC